MNSTKNLEHEKAKCHYEVHQADVYTKHRYRPPKESILAYPLKTYFNDLLCCCPDDVPMYNKTISCDINENGQSNSPDIKLKTDFPDVELEVPMEQDDQRHDKKRANDGEPRMKLNCCSKRACKKTSSNCTELSPILVKSKVSKMKLKREKRDFKEKEKEERMRLRSSVKEVKRRTKMQKKKSKCSCLKKLKKLNDKCCATSDLVFNPKSIKCQVSDTNATKSMKVKLSAKNTKTNDICCTCKRPTIQDQFRLYREEETNMDRIEEQMEEQEEQNTGYQKSRNLFENTHENKAIDEQRQNAGSEGQEDPTFIGQGQQSEDEAQPHYQQLILNRNINIYLQIEKFNKQKPILLSRKQYDKVKKALEGKMGPSKVGKSGRIQECCPCSVGEIKVKYGENKLKDAAHANYKIAAEASQNTSWLFIAENKTVPKVRSMTTAQIKSTGESPKQSLIQQIYQGAGAATDGNKIKELTNIKQNTKKTQYKAPEPMRHTQNDINYIKKGNNSSGLKCAHCGRKTFQLSNCLCCKKKEFQERYEDQRHYIDNDNFCNICRMVQDLQGDIIYPMEKQKSSIRRAVSSAEIHYANINTEKRVTFSSTYLDDNVLRQASSHFLLKKHSSNSLYTLFKGRCK